MVDYGGTDAGANNRTRLRRLQRAHTLQCLRDGLKQQQHLTFAAQQVAKVAHGSELQIVGNALAVHTADSMALQHDVHYGSMANNLAYHNGFKSRRTFQEHARLHQAANIIKHEVYSSSDVGYSSINFIDSSKFMPMPPLPEGLLSVDLEEFRAGLFAKITDDNPGGSNNGGLCGTAVCNGHVCSFCGIWETLLAKSSDVGYNVCNIMKVFATDSSSVSDEVVEVQEVGSSPSAADDCANPPHFSRFRRTPMDFDFT